MRRDRKGVGVVKIHPALPCVKWQKALQGRMICVPKGFGVIGFKVKKQPPFGRDRLEGVEVGGKREASLWAGSCGGELVAKDAQIRAELGLFGESHDRRTFVHHLADA